MSTVIRVEDLSKRYVIGSNNAGSDGLRHAIHGFFTAPFKAFRNLQSEEFWALRDVSFEVSEGEVVGIVGRNGAGKSTLLKILSRITEPTTGRVGLRGRVASLLEVGTGFHPELTGRENVFLNGAILGMTREEIRRKFDEIVAFAELDKFLDTPVKRYSSGMYVRLAFAVAAHLEPEILIVDEVLAVGDAQFQKKSLGKMGAVAKEGRTVLFVSHSMAAVRRLCERVVLLDAGRVVEDGTTNLVVSKYLEMSQPSESVTREDVRRFLDKLPPDRDFKLKNVSVLQHGEFSTVIQNGDPVIIETEYEVFRETPGMHVSFQLLDQEGSILIESINNGENEQYPRVLPGSYVSRAFISANFLAPTRYELRIMAGIADVRSCLPEPLKIALTVEPTGRLNRAYPGYLTPAKLAPVIDWETERVGEFATHSVNKEAYG